MNTAPSLVTRVTQSKLSYYLLGKRIYFILNSNARSGNISKIIRSLSKSFPLYSFNVLLSNATKTAGELTRDVLTSDSLFIVMGGDGTVNNSVQHLINSPATFGLIPRGTANDLAAAYNIPHSIPKALQIISEGHITKIDAIKVNSNFVLTIGSIGFPSVVADAVNRFKAGGLIFRGLHKYILRSSIYKIFAFGLLLFKGAAAAKHSGRVKVDGKVFYEGDFVAVFFGKQSFLGKTFQPCPETRPEDPDLCVSVLKFKNLWELFKDLRSVSKGRSQKVENLIWTKAQSFEIDCEHFEHLLGDGEILDYEDTFRGIRVPKALKLITPRKYS